jgi:hypothetical protein
MDEAGDDGAAKVARAIGRRGVWAEIAPRSQAAPAASAARGC